VHPEGMVLLFDMAGRNPANVRHPVHSRVGKISVIMNMGASGLGLHFKTTDTNWGGCLAPRLGLLATLR
jgi:hypothetical protein